MVDVDEVLHLLDEHVGADADDVEVLAIVGRCTQVGLSFIHAGPRQYLVADGYAVQYGETADGRAEQVTYQSGAAVGRTSGPG